MKLRGLAVAVVALVLLVLGSPAQADTYTTMKHSCASDRGSLYIKTDWGGSYYRYVSRCDYGPSGVNGGHRPVAFYVPSGWCAGMKLYTNGSYALTSYRIAGWHNFVKGYFNSIFLYDC
jgi:hypothetical protein